MSQGNASECDVIMQAAEKLTSIRRRPRVITQTLALKRRGRVLSSEDSPREASKVCPVTSLVGEWGIHHFNLKVQWVNST